MKNLLLTPGPIPVPQDIRELMAEPIFHHRTPQYQQIFERVSKKLQKAFLTANPVYTITGSGTSAMEAAMANLHSTGDEVLVIDGGKFGERFTELASAFGLKATVLKVTWGEAVNPNEVRAALEKNPNFKSVCVQLCETSTAVLHDVKALAAITAKTNAILIVDAISGVGADRLETDAWGIDVVIAGSQKALMLPPGLGFISISAKAKPRIASSNIPKYYLDLKLYEKAIKDWDTPFTPAITLVLGLERALDKIEKEGIENVWKRSEELAKFTREKLQGLGLTLLSKAPSAAVTGAFVPEGINGEKLVKVMRDEKGVTVAGGQGHLKGKIVRIAHMGSITKKDLEEGLGIFAETLNEFRKTASVAK